MATFREAISQASEAAICSLLAGTEAASWLGGSLRIGGGPNAFAEAVRRARLGFCNNPDPDVALPEAPFQGGQCDGVKYTFRWDGETWTRTVCGSNPTQQQTTLNRGAGVWGPISNLRVENANPGNCGSTTQRYLVDGRNSSTGPIEPITLISVSSSNANVTTSNLVLKNLRLTRDDGQPDNCGDPEGPPVPPYSPVTFTTNVTYEDNSQTTVTEEGDFILLAPVIVGGNLIAPITVNLGGLEVPVEVNLSTGDITLDFGPNDTPTPIVDENPVENPTEDEPEIEESDLIYGLVVYSARVGSVSDITTLVAQQSAPSLRLPRTGNVYFQVPVGDRVSWLGPIPVQMENQLVRVPWGMGATGYRLVPNTGWAMSAIRLGKPPCGCSSA